LRAVPPPIPLTTRLVTDRLVLRPPRPGDVPELRRLLRKNTAHLQPWSPKPAPGEDPASLTVLSKNVLLERRGWRQDHRYVFLVTTREKGAPIVGRAALSQVSRGPMQAAYLGYWMDQERQGQGLMTEAVRAVLDFAFSATGARLHRVQINVIPRNAASHRVVEKVAARKEGLALRYLEIAGVWEDHVMYAVTVEEWNSSAGRTIPS
jgi:[ribosomal protein S5]-alanine N-acetyltransferase